MPARRCCAGAIPATSPPSWWTGWRRWTASTRAGSPPSSFAVAGPVLVLLRPSGRTRSPPLVLLLAGLLVPVGMAAGRHRRGGGLAPASSWRWRGCRPASSIGCAASPPSSCSAAPKPRRRRLAAAADELRARTMRVLRVAFLSSAVLDLAAAAALVVLAIRYGLALLAGRLGPPGLALFVLLLVPEFFAPLRTFAAAYQDRLHATGAAESLIDLPPAPPPAPRPRGAHRRRPGRDRGVRERAASPGTRRAGRRWTACPSASPPGETLVLAGPSGAGKSSCIEILLGFVRPDSGRVTINGADIADLVPQALSRLTAWIGQRPVLFAGTIRDNIRFARPEATDDEVAEAARAARVAEFAAALPQGLDTRWARAAMACPAARRSAWRSPARS